MTTPATFALTAEAGDIVTCDRGHPICTVATFAHDPLKLEMFKDWRDGREPKEGDKISRRCFVEGCDGVWVTRQGICRRPAPRSPICHVGDRVTCPNGHDICLVAAPIHQVWPIRLSNFVEWADGLEPVSLMDVNRRCARCGERWIDESRAAICIAKQWRTLPT